MVLRRSALVILSVTIAIGLLGVTAVAHARHATHPRAGVRGKAAAETRAVASRRQAATRMQRTARGHERGGSARHSMGWLGSRLLSPRTDDWEPAVAADPHAPYVYMLTT